MSQDVIMVDSVAQAAVMLKPLRVAMLREMAEPRTCGDLAGRFGLTPQKVYYHVKTMERAGLVERTGQRTINGIAEGFYRARARAYWFSPELVRRLGGADAARDQTSLHVLAQHAEEMMQDVGRLAERSAEGESVPSLSLSVDVDLPDGPRRAEFLEELKTKFEELAARYTGSSGDAERGTAFRFTLACYPQTHEERV